MFGFWGDGFGVGCLMDAIRKERLLDAFLGNSRRLVDIFSGSLCLDWSSGFLAEREVVGWSAHYIGRPDQFLGVNVDVSFLVMLFHVFGHVFIVESEGVRAGDRIPDQKAECF